MAGEVLLDAGAMTRCRRRVHLEHDPALSEPPSPLDPTAEQRIADAAAHRRTIADRLAAVVDGTWVEIDRDLAPPERAEATERALAEGADYVWGGVLPADRAAGRRGGAELLVRGEGGYLPVLVVRHRITDPGQGARTTAPTDLDPANATEDDRRKVRGHTRDQMRLAHVRRLLLAAGHAEPGRAVGGVIGLDADVVLWLDLDAPTWPGGHSTLAEYDIRFADRVAVARAAANGDEPLARPSRVLECRHCPWWALCGEELREVRDVSLVVRGEDATALRVAGVSTVDKLAALDPDDPLPVLLTGNTFAVTVALARAWLAGLSVVRMVDDVEVPRADVEVDVDMESFGDSGAYLWGTLLSVAPGVDLGVDPGYRAFVTWDPLPTEDEARSFAEFWTWLMDVRARAVAQGLSFRAYCYNALAENRWLFGSVDRFGGHPGIPSVPEVKSFVDSPEWVDLFASVSETFLCAKGKGLKVIAPVAGFHWRDPEAGGEASMRWYREAVALEGGTPDLTQRRRLLEYNEDDVQATKALRTWMTSPQVHTIPHLRDL